MTSSARLPDRELSQVLEPEFNSDTFQFGKNQDDSSRKWKLIPLPWKYEKNFRKQVMPMLAISYKPFENVISLLSRDYLSENVSTNLVQSLFLSEIEMDEHLTRSLHAILIAQDKTITTEWVEDMAESREQLLEIVIKQCEVHKIMDRLGESLAERFAKLAQMMGIEVDLPSLKRLWKQVSEVLSARITKAASLVDSATGLSMESLSETTFQSGMEPREAVAEAVKFVGSQEKVRPIS